MRYCLKEKTKMRVYLFEPKAQNKQDSIQYLMAELIYTAKSNKEDLVELLDLWIQDSESKIKISEILNDINSNYEETLKMLMGLLSDKTAKRFECKTRYFKWLLSKKKNIVTTHALIQLIDEETMGLISMNDYTLIIDECLDTVHRYSERKLTQDDISFLTNNNMTVTDDKGFLIWTYKEYEKGNDSEYIGRFGDIKRLCKMDSLMKAKDKKNKWCNKYLIWQFPVKFFSLFKDTYICTYLWDSSIQKAYFQLHGIRYKHCTLSNDKKLIPYDIKLEEDRRKQFKQLINIYEGKLNNVGDPDFYKCFAGKKPKPLCKTWYKNPLGEFFFKVLKNNTLNFFQNIQKSPGNKNMYTTYDGFQQYIKGKGYSKSFLSCNAIATNDYQDKNCLAYLIDFHISPKLNDYFKRNGISINEDLYSLSFMLQWIWRSAIRNNQPINIYIPSKRMRTLLKDWLDCKI